MPPIHPSIVHFPIALVTLSVMADLFGRLTDSATLRAAGFWALIGAVVGGALAIVAGLFDMNRERIEHAAHERVHFHMKVGFTLFAAVAGLTVWRWLIYANAQNTPGWGYLVAALLVFGLTLFQGYLGGELVYADGVGVAPTGQGTEPPPEAQERVANVAHSGSGQVSHGGH
jgi:uncharacterized membrane protein